MRKALVLAVALIVASLISVAWAQSRRAPAPASVSAFEQATRALHGGRYDEVPTLLEKLDQQDPLVVALIARSLIARGKYQEAETTLRPAAQRGPASEAALELGLLLRMLGRRAQADPILTRVAAAAELSTDPASLARSARALRALGRFYDANGAYRNAASMAPRSVPINTAWGDLFLEKYDNAEALKSYQAALAQDPSYVPALIGSARALADDDPPEAMKIVERALELNPSSVEAHIFVAEQDVDAGRRDKARRSIDKALAVNPASLEAHALLGALNFVEDKQQEFEAEIARVLAIAPNYGEAYRIAGELASHNFRYDDATALARKGLSLDPDNAQLMADFGIHLLRTGDEDEARDVLTRSFKLDGFNKVTYNLLTMMDTLDTFVTTRDRDVIVRMDKADASVLGERAMALTHEALETLSKRYQFTPKGPILVEIFPKHDHFAVRTAGLPGMLGALGVCFGRVVVMDSPRALPNQFQWEATLWHELTHVVTLQMSSHRVPRWLTEGISVYEEKLHNAAWSRGMEFSYANLLGSGQTLRIRDLNSGFTDPRKVMLAYFEASLLVEHIVEKWGDTGLHRLLRAYGQGLDTEGALKAALDTDFETLQAGFDQTMTRDFGKLIAALRPPADRNLDLTTMKLERLKEVGAMYPDTYTVQMTLGNVLREAGDLDGALAAFERASIAMPLATGPESPNEQVVDIALQKKDKARAIAALQRIMAADFDNVAAPRQLAILLREEKISDPERLGSVFQRIAAIDPFDADARRMLGRIMMQANRPADAVPEFKAVIALNPVDQAAAHTDLAESYLRSGKRAEARKETLAALEIAPSYERAQNLLLELAEGRP